MSNASLVYIEEEKVRKKTGALNARRGYQRSNPNEEDEDESYLSEEKQTGVGC